MAIIVQDNEQGVQLEFDDWAHLKDWLNAQKARFEPSQSFGGMLDHLGEVFDRSNRRIEEMYRERFGRAVPNVDLGAVRRPQTQRASVHEVFPELPESTT